MAEERDVKKYYRMEEVEERYPLKRTQVYELIRSGTLTAYCKNGAGSKPIFLKAADLDAYFESLKVPKEKWNE